MTRRRHSVEASCSGEQSTEAGSTLVEMLVTIVVISTAVVGIMSALMFGARGSGEHRRQVTADTVLKTYAESIAQTVAGSGYVTCASTSTYQSPTSFTPVSGYTAEVLEVRFWDGTKFASSLPTCSNSPKADLGLQWLKLQVKANDLPNEQTPRDLDQVQIVVRKP